MNIEQWVPQIPETAALVLILTISVIVLLVVPPKIAITVLCILPLFWVITIEQWIPVGVAIPILIVYTGIVFMACGKYNDWQGVNKK